jgi:transcriptional regulator with XRE-family HTH domain
MAYLINTDEIRRLITERRMRKTDLAARAGICREHLSRILHRSSGVSEHTARALARALEVEVGSITLPGSDCGRLTPSEMTLLDMFSRLSLLGQAEALVSVKRIFERETPEIDRDAGERR